MKEIVFISVLILGSFISGLFLIFQTYEFRVSFSQIEKLNKTSEDLSFKSNLLLNEVEYFRNQIAIRKIATEGLGMISPQTNSQVIIYRKEN